VQKEVVAVPKGDRSGLASRRPLVAGGAASVALLSAWGWGRPELDWEEAPTAQLLRRSRGGGSTQSTAWGRFLLRGSYRWNLDGGSFSEVQK
jgi:hypothetical protein